ncbi:MAG TPA: GTP cyclohydrolase I [Acidimicrobiales bacterium]|jgi:GTP cyclohydrolase I|nr:GTP cyclohydrolase I [Acidimicrobiales bacterium]
MADILIQTAETATLLPPHPLDPDQIEAGIRLVLHGLGQSDKAEVIANTPRRVTDLYAEMVNPGWADVEEVFKSFENSIGYDDLVIVNDVHYVSLCEHHLMPAFGVAHFAYVPDERIVGYSKIKKGLNYVARGPQLNERILIDTLDIVEAQLRPKGAALILQTVHCCIAVRSNGPAQEIVTVQGFRGALRQEPYRREFFDTVLARKPLFLGQ